MAEKYHEHNFVEEMEDSGIPEQNRKILGPCLECGLPAAEAIKKAQQELSDLRELEKRHDLILKAQQNIVDAMIRLTMPLGYWHLIALYHDCLDDRACLHIKRVYETLRQIGFRDDDMRYSNW